MAGDFGKTPRFELFFNKLTERLGNVFLHNQHALMASDFVPDAFELDIRKGHNLKLNYAEGKTLLFGGIIDRIDVCNVGDEKYLRIIDYKSSKKQINEVSLASGINMQTLTYLFAVCDENGAYSDYKPAGVLYNPMEISGIEIEQAKIDEFNQTAVNSQLKNTGLLIDRKDILEKMEHGLGGKYIPAKLKTDGEFDRYSSVVSEDGMDRLRDFVYSSITDAAENVLNGNAEANPLRSGKKMPCDYCKYANICGNGDGKKYHEADSKKLKEAAKILGKECDE
jgi:ATP-dependent helicase/nuclease subunit B